MPEDPGQSASGDDLFGRWLAHRDAEDAAGMPARDRARPPAWAPPVVTPRSHAESSADPEPDVEAPTLDAPLAEEPADLPEDDLAEDVSEPAPEPDPARHKDARRPAAAPPTTQEPPVRLTFRPRTRARTAVGIGALLAASAGVVGCYVAARERDTPSIGIAVTLWILTAIIWAVHSGTSVTRLSVRGGQLQVQQHGVRTTIDLTSSYTPVEVHGRPGRHGWKVVFRRRDMTPFVIDHSMVDPAEFMRVLRYYRPGIDGEAE